MAAKKIVENEDKRRGQILEAKLLEEMKQTKGNNANNRTLSFGPGRLAQPTLEDKILQWSSCPKETSFGKSMHNLMLDTMIDNIDDALEEELRNTMSTYKVVDVDEYADGQSVFGLQIPEKLLWEGYVMPHSISFEEGSEYDTGRSSMPEFQKNEY